ncbi:MAG: hypothetical protein QOE70_5807 [Chthoniobacter sp.]|nr:hypothetical protein [Chthoniobacter sp.]
MSCKRCASAVLMLIPSKYEATIAANSAVAASARKRSVMSCATPTMPMTEPSAARIAVRWTGKVLPFAPLHDELPRPNLAGQNLFDDLLSNTARGGRNENLRDLAIRHLRSGPDEKLLRIAIPKGDLPLEASGNHRLLDDLHQTRLERQSLLLIMEGK